MNVASISPREENDIIYWYQGDTFYWNMIFNMIDANSNPITIQSTDVITVIFKRNIKDADADAVYTFTFSNIINNEISMEFTSTISNLFAWGNYYVGVNYTYGTTGITTLIAQSEVVVEGVI